MTKKCNPGIGAVPVNVIMIVLQIGPTVLSILGMAIIEVTVDVEYLTGQVSFNFSMVCKVVDVKSTKGLNICVSYICFADHRS